MADENDGVGGNESFGVRFEAVDQCSRSLRLTAGEPEKIDEVDGVLR